MLGCPPTIGTNALSTCGRNVLAWEEKNAAVTLHLYDAWNQDHVLYHHQFARGSRGQLIDGEEVAVLEPNGQFTVVSLSQYGASQTG